MYSYETKALSVSRSKTSKEQSVFQVNQDLQKLDEDPWQQIVYPYTDSRANHISDVYIALNRNFDQA